MDLGGRTALLTSATGGLGRAIATALAARGARLILSSRKTEESPVRMTRALLPRWQQRGSGHIVVVSSISGFASTPRASLYAATKFGLRGFALNLREDLRGTGVGVSVITPGMIREAGMFADSGAAPPPGIGTGTPHQVGNGVVRAIERDKLEISVAPLRQRALARFAMMAPEIAGRLGGSTATKAADAIASGQTEKR